MQLYLDYSATTPCRPEVIAAMQDSLTEDWGNPASLHQWGQRAAYAVEQAREQVAKLLNAASESLVFTSGGTESNNLALLGVARCFAQPKHLIISSVEHPAIAKTALYLEQQGWQVSRLPVDEYGRVNPLDLQATLRSNTVLVSVIYGQSEVGTLQPIESLGAITQSAGALFHTDAVQAVGRIPIDVQTLPVDLLSLSSHKIYGPQGVGALYIKPGTSLFPLLNGGGQEQGLRSGTPPVAAITGFGIAAQCALQELTHEPQRLRDLRDGCHAQLKDWQTVQLTGHPYYRLPHHLSLCVTLPLAETVTGRTLVKQMNLAGIGISAGSACHSGKSQPSPTLLAMGYPPLLAQSGIRLTFGHATKSEDIDWVILTLRQVLTRLGPDVVITH